MYCAAQQNLWQNMTKLFDYVSSSVMLPVPAEGGREQSAGSWQWRGPRFSALGDFRKGGGQQHGNSANHSSLGRGSGEEAVGWKLCYLVQRPWDLHWEFQLTGGELLHLFCIMRNHVLKYKWDSHRLKHFTPTSLYGAVQNRLFYPWKLMKTSKNNL